jgi:putative sterol carrier protein
MKAKSVTEFFQLLPNELDAEAAEDVDAVYQFDLTGAEGGQYIVAIRQGACRVTQGTHEDPDVTLSMAGEDCVKVLAGQLSGQTAAMSGRLKVSGDLGLALQLRALFPGIASS